MTKRDQDLLDLAYWDSLVIADAWILATLAPARDVELTVLAGACAGIAIEKARLGIGCDDTPDWGGD